MRTSRGIGVRTGLLAGALALVSGTGAFAGQIPLTAHLTGTSTGSGDGAFFLDDTVPILLSSVDFSDLSTASGGFAGAVIILGPSGTLLHTLDTSSVTTGATAGSFTDIWTGLTPTDISILESDSAWITIQTVKSPTGQISGQMMIREPGSLALMTIGVGVLGGTWLLRWRSGS
jgi:hypothetical protein